MYVCNNCDKGYTTKEDAEMCCFDEAVPDFYATEDCCDECGIVLDESCYVTESVSHPYSSSMCEEVVSLGYVCKNCGHTEGV